MPLTPLVPKAPRQCLELSRPLVNVYFPIELEKQGKKERGKEEAKETSRQTRLGGLRNLDVEERKGGHETRGAMVMVNSRWPHIWGWRWSLFSGSL